MLSWTYLPPDGVAWGQLKGGLTHDSQLLLVRVSGKQGQIILPQFHTGLVFLQTPGQNIEGMVQTL